MISALIAAGILIASTSPESAADLPRTATPEPAAGEAFEMPAPRNHARQPDALAPETATVGAADLPRPGTAQEATAVTAAELVENCRKTIPQDVELIGRIILRNRKGIAQAEYNYDFKRDAGATKLSVKDAAGKEIQFAREGRLLGTDVTWSDITLDYLWWDEFEFDAEREGETVNGQVCCVILMKKGAREVRVWVDRKHGAMMQAEELEGGKAVRRLWGTRIKKFGERWIPNVLEVETLGSGHRTKITVEEMK